MKIKIFKNMKVSNVESNVNNWLADNEDKIIINNIQHSYNNDNFVIIVAYEDLCNKFNYDYWISQDDEKHYPKDMTTLHIKNVIKKLEGNYVNKCCNFKIYNIMKEELKERKEGKEYV